MTFTTERVKNAIDQLHDQSPLWGIMTAHHMVEHLQLSVGISVGKPKMTSHLQGDKLERSLAFLASDMPMPKGVKPKFLKDGLMDLKFESIEAAKEALMLSVEAFLKYYETGEETEIHPVFGPQNEAGWIRIHVKHFTHHLEQFGVDF